jgi:hypothetical protein
MHRRRPTSVPHVEAIGYCCGGTVAAPSCAGDCLAFRQPRSALPQPALLRHALLNSPCTEALSALVIRRHAAELNMQTVPSLNITYTEEKGARASNAGMRLVRTMLGDVANRGE